MAARTPPRPLMLASVEECCPPGPGLLPRSDAEQVAALFKALGDPVRVQLLSHIAGAQHGTACACHLPEALGISQPTLSHHLKKLTDAGLVTREQRGRWAHYTVQPTVLRQLADFVGDAAPL